ncbi:hypothetical protein SAMN02745121_08637 [Nannocystis exedens]|uniref:Uncharacterized protein n=1 Tax=Nannocystis exedens TaxID=54 RepID=A0A1I2IH30_9BACT|nr:hypothetical protein NAEX_01242 [Nannocystis exedens]SFF40367.1 hypothetical protein SAMN02745121_08637 [Nannocystis exedens]
MKWGVQHVKVTLESDSGETVVIEQDANGRVKCEPARTDKRERAANTRPQRATAADAGTPAKPKTEPRRVKTEAKRSEDAASKANADTRPRAKADAKPRAEAAAAPKAKPDAKQARANQTPPPRKDRRLPLEWEPTTDHGYEGFTAASGVGVFKVLYAKDSQWALFYEVKGFSAKHLGCFGKLRPAQTEAQKRHNEGWPQSGGESITADQIAHACPVPSGRSQEEDEEMTTPAEAAPEQEKPARQKPTRRKPTPKAEEKPEPAEPAPKEEPTAEEPAPKTDAERDEELMNSFASKLDGVLDEDDDD